MINKKSGFTLLEILLVIGIIAVLVGIVIVAINPSKTLATVRNTERKSDLKQIDSALAQYYIDNNDYPASLTGVSDLTEICDTGSASATTTAVNGELCDDLINLSELVPKYLTAIPNDPIATTTKSAGYKVIRSGRRVSLSASGELGQTIARGATTYTVTYDGNGNTSGTVPSTQTKVENTTLALRNNSGTLAKTGYTFAGWNTSSNGSGTDYAEGTNYTTNAGVTLFAKWTTNTYTVTYNGNGNTGGSTATQTLTYNTPTALTANGFTRTGYTFAGWNTLANGSGTNYADTASYTIGAANVTLFAKWTTNTYTVTYNGNGNTGGSTATQTLTYNTPTALTANGFTRTGYTFAGWNTLANGSGTNYADTASYTIGAANVTLFAKWTVADACSHVPTDPDCWSADNITAGHTIWSTENVNTDAMSDTDGRANSDHVMANHANANPWATNNYRAIAACDQYTGGGYTDWYLPAKDELLAAYGVVSGFTSLSYWSSTDTDWWDSAWYFGMGFGGSGRDYKNAAYYHVRCLR